MIIVGSRHCRGLRVGAEVRFKGRILPYPDTKSLHFAMSSGAAAVPRPYYNYLANNILLSW